MNLYEQGFADGEKQAFRDRVLRKVPKTKPQEKLSAYARGYWDGYTPRTLTWAVHSKPVAQHVEAEA